jgi:hypothetical protein
MLKLKRTSYLVQMDGYAAFACALHALHKADLSPVPRSQEFIDFLEQIYFNPSIKNIKGDFLVESQWFTTKWEDKYDENHLHKSVYYAFLAITKLFKAIVVSDNLSMYRRLLNKSILLSRTAAAMGRMKDYSMSYDNQGKSVLPPTFDRVVLKYETQREDDWQKKFFKDLQTKRLCQVRQYQAV